MRVRWGRVAVVATAALAGGALTAALVASRSGNDAAGDRAAAVAAGIASASPSGPSGPSGPATSGLAAPTSPAPAPAPAELPQLTARPATPTPVAPVAAPTRVVVGRLGIDMPVEPHGVNPDGLMSLPASPETAGWYEYASTPDAAAGSTVIAAHVDSKTGVGPFVRLGTARAGDEVDVYVGGTVHAYRVTQVVRVDKVAVDNDGLFAVDGPPRLHLVTCTGDYVPGSGYTQNLVVIAEPR